MQLTTLLINALMASLAAAGNTHNDPKACYNGAIGGKRDLEQRLSSRYALSGTIEKRLRQTRAICLACCHGAAMFCDAACRAEFSGPGAAFWSLAACQTSCQTVGAACVSNCYNIPN
ncbi:hypothetical protein E4U30_002068 [Claviceps sp. LM220 group G6]|nr:hypothetical protein E4U15_008048 [Claviceps sp. LM218 group G6]KAG6101395.1 hypothetical protein E4U30_002068 [Claviceps sp. LM220 group G6]KAG6111360.1 hypothetical protein E4U31_004550 [Claviceps sp. LM219 group G6]